jgi:hypothetical protein
MGVVIGFVWLVIGYVLMQTGIQVWAALMLPNPVERARQRVLRQPTASFFVGLAFWVVSFTAGVFLIRIPGAGSVIGYALMAPMLAASVIGGAAFSRILAERIKTKQRNESEISALIGGALATTVATLLPVIGWFMFLPLVGFIGIGAGALALVSRRRVAEDNVGVPAAVPTPDAHAAAWAGYQQNPQAPSAAWGGYPSQPANS